MAESPREQADSDRAPWRELLARALTGDQGAERQLLAEIRPYLKDCIEKTSGGQPTGVADASDIAQAALLEVWRHAGRLDGTTEGQFRAWLQAVARNEFLTATKHAQQQCRDVRRSVPLPQDSAGAVPLAADTSSPSQRASRREEEEMRQEALRHLGPEDQLVLDLRLHQQRDWPEVAAQMGRTEMAVKQLYYRAVKRWKRALGDVS